MPLPIITVAQMREWEAATWAAGIASSSVIAEAGHAIACVALRRTQPLDRILVLAGKGHNGDDARAVVAGLTGRKADVLTVTDPGAALALFSQQAARKTALIVDGLFGIGLNRPLAADWIELIARINQSGIPVLAIDVPSGLNADTGQPQGAAVQAELTVTLGAPKAGLLKTSAAPFVGRLEVAADIGLIPCPIRSEMQWTQAEDFADFPLRRPVGGHKGTFGHLAILAGSLGFHGAAVLAARGASRAMPGLITLFTAENVYAPVAAQLHNVMVRPGRPTFAELHDFSAVVVGPGLADEKLSADLKELTAEVWRQLDRPVIADASALDWLSAGPTTTTALRVITPHPGEAARLLQVATSAVQADRPASVRSLSARFGNCHVALKGNHTIVGRNTGEIFFNSSGNPHLAQGGSGDVLAGYLGGLLAQPQFQPPSAALRAMRYAVWQHGAAADRLSARANCWTLEELLATLGNAT